MSSVKSLLYFIPALSRVSTAVLSAIAGVLFSSLKCPSISLNVPFFTSSTSSVAQAIFDKKPVGVQTVGDVTETVLDSGGGSHTIKFTWTTEVPIYVKCTITTTADFSAANLQEIKDNIVEKLAAYTNDQDVTATSLYAPIYVDGVTDVTALTISDDDITYVSDKIDINYSEVARTIAANIEVTVS